MGWINGIILGILGVLIGGTIFGGIGIAMGYLLGFIALISGAIPGLMFGYSTRNKSKLPRALISAVLGFTSILFGYYIVYQTIEIPVEYYWITLHVKPSEVMSFSEFMSAIVDVKDLLFFAIGIIESSVLGTRDYGG